MTCPTCGGENQNGNFCNNCANPLKEKCAECGEMEAIGRKVCESEYKRICNLKQSFAYSESKNDKRVRIAYALAYMELPLIFPLFFLLFKKVIPFQSINAVPIMFILYFLLALRALHTQDKIYDEYALKFLEIHPEHKEVIAKVEGEKP